MRVYNFSAGPCTLPLEVLEEARDELVDYRGAGMSLIEMSHRSAAYDEVHQGTADLAKSLYGTPDDFEVLFLGGGATLQFGMVPLNLLEPGGRAAYIDSGAWGAKAIADAAVVAADRSATVDVVWSGRDGGYRSMPAPGALGIADGTRYLHVTSNETIHGIRMSEFPDVGVPLVGDMSSDYMSRPIPWDLFDVVYGGAQKNLGPAGVTIVFVRRSAIGERALPAYLRYDIHAAKESLYNTPPVFAIYMVGKVLAWMERQGGVEQMQREAATKSGWVYDAIEASEGFYTSPVAADDRSHMNIVFRLPTPELESAFVAGAADRGMVNLKGHRSVGGVRASIYNAMPRAGVEALVSFMHEFRA